MLQSNGRAIALADAWAVVRYAAGGHVGRVVDPSAVAFAPMAGGGNDTRLLVVFVEIPAGSRNKYEVDEKTGAIFLDRRLFTSTTYPADYGFIENTLGGDGDPLDALVLAGDPTFPGCRIRARPIGLFRMTDEKGPDEKIICVSARDPFWGRFEDLGELDENLRNEIDHFFRVYKELETDKVDTRGFGDRSEAERVIAEALARYVDSGSTR